MLPPAERPGEVVAVATDKKPGGDSLDWNFKQHFEVKVGGGETAGTFPLAAAQTLYLFPVAPHERSGVNSTQTCLIIPSVPQPHNSLAIKK